MATSQCLAHCQSSPYCKSRQTHVVTSTRYCVQRSSKVSCCTRRINFSLCSHESGPHSSRFLQRPTARAERHRDSQQSEPCPSAGKRRGSLLQHDVLIPGICLACLAVFSLGAVPEPANAALLDMPQYELAAEISPGTAKLLALIAQPVLSLGIFFMLVRIVLSWYPNVKGDKLPWSVAVLPTEFFLGPTRKALPPVGGVDIAPVSARGHTEVDLLSYLCSSVWHSCN